ncbi:MAG TPA: hypothetical protein VGB70_08975 [Allosphingosinicella sp.]|jgi:hypothetical protein
MRTKAPLLPLLLALPLASCAATGRTAADPVLAKGVAANADFARTRFIEKGLQPIEAAAREGRELRRVLVSAFVPGDLPALELERSPDGTVTLNIARAGVVEQRIAVAPETWKRIAALDDSVFEAPPPRVPTPEGARSASCHGIGAFFESSSRGKVRQASARQCAGSVSPFNSARLQVMNTLVDLALAARPGCGREPGEEADWPLSRCFAPPAR